MTWRRRAKWAATAAAMLVLAVWLLSGWFRAGVRYDTQARTFVCGIVAGGVIWVDHEKVGASELSPATAARGLSHVGPDSMGPHWGWWPAVEQGFWYRESWLQLVSPWVRVINARDRASWVPLWIPFVLLVAASAWLWHRDRRRGPGSCAKCGYDLSGTPGGVCPECGAWS